MLVIGDIHGKLEIVKKVLDLPGRKLFIGDILDSYDRKPNEQIECLERILSDNDTDLMMGNYKASYIYGNQMRASGFNALTFTLIIPFLSRLQRKAIWHFPIREYGILITHAGISRCLTGDLSQHEIFDMVDSWAFRPHESPFFQIGKARGGNYKTGGPLWCDWNTEFQPIQGLRQIVGHTAVPSIVPG